VAVIRRQRGQSLVELALALPGIAVGLLLVVGLGILGEAKGGVQAVAGEAARAGALSDDAATAQTAGEARGYAVADGYHLDADRLLVTVDTSDFHRGGTVRASVEYTLPLHELLPGIWGDLPLEAHASEPVDEYRSFY
jgi:Flp pilus assembly protein TadG